MYKTFVGGCFSLMLILAFITYAALSLHLLIVYPVLVSNSESFYHDRSDAPADTYNVTTKNSTLAVFISSGSVFKKQTNQQLRVVFMQHNASTNRTTYIPAVNCTDFFAEEIQQP